MNRRSRFAAWVACIATGAQIVHADGRREEVADPSKDSNGRWTAVIEGRRTLLEAGEVVVIVDAAGHETVTIPSLVEGAERPELPALLASLCDPKNPRWELDAAAQLAKPPTRAAFDRLVALTSDASLVTRRRAIAALARLRTSESVTAAANATLAEKDSATRRDAASTLFSVQEIFKRCDAAKCVEKGIKDGEAAVRIVFAMLSPRDHAAATAVLKKEGLKSADHHVRESSALELGRRGDKSGEAVLIEILGRTRLTGVTDDAALADRLLRLEQIEVCEILGSLKSEKAIPALQHALSSRFPDVRKSAADALSAMGIK